MKNVYKQMVPTEITWRRGDWDGDGLRVSRRNSTAYIRHESDIEANIPNAPNTLKDDVRQIVMDNRKAGANEHRDAAGYLWQFRINDRGEFEWRCAVRGAWGPWVFVRDLLTLKSSLGDAARAWFEKNAPEQQLPLRYYEQAPLAPNQIWSPDDFTRGGSVVVSLRWHEGVPEYKWGDNDWMPVVLHLDTAAFMRGWFRDNCPPDRFVMDGGRVFEFSMQDNGEALATCGESVHLTAPGDPGPHASGMIRALYKFRDEERARWTTERITHGALGEVVQVYQDGHPLGWFSSKRGQSASLRDAPKWVQERAKQQLSEGVVGPDMIVEDEAHFTPGSHLNEKVDRVWHTKAGVFIVCECPECGNPARSQQTGSDKGDITCDSCLLPRLRRKLGWLEKKHSNTIQKLEAKRESLKKKLEDVQKLNEELATSYYKARDTLKAKQARSAKRPTWINVNAHVRVLLTPEGVKQWNQNRATGHASIEQFVETRLYRFQLWELMNIFGSKMVMHGPQMFVDNVVFLEKPKSEDEREQDPKPAPAAPGPTVGDINLSLTQKGGTFDLTRPPIADHKTSSGRPPEGLPAEKSFLLGANETQAWWVNLKWVWGSTYRILDVTVEKQKADR